MQALARSSTRSPWRWPALRAAQRWRRHFAEESSGGGDESERNVSSPLPSSDVRSQIDVVQGILDDVKVDDDDRELELEQAKEPAPREPTFGDLLANIGVRETHLESWFRMQNFQDEELPILEELSPTEIKLREKAKRRAEEMRKMKELADSRVRTVDRYGVAHATGKRKESIAIIDLKEGTGKISVNRMSHDLYFTLLDHRVHYLEPFVETKTLGKFDVNAQVRGGGISGQAGAMRHGISKALQLFDPELRPPLRKGGYLTRDPRVVERKKPGRAKARKSFQWVKR